MTNYDLDKWHLLKHPFYRSWDKGELTIGQLQEYAVQYYRHVEYFPRHLSKLHSKCDSIEQRKIILENLVDEESGDDHHPELWLRFAEGLGLSRDVVKSSKSTMDTKYFISTYDNLCESYPKGLGALYAYERQIPSISEFKIKSLKEHYDISDERSIEFFKVHMHADVWHSQEVQDIIESLSESDKEKAFYSAYEATKLLWGFLDQFCTYNRIYN